MIRHETALIDGCRTAYRRADWKGDVPTVYVHGVPTYSFDWDPFLERVGGLAFDLPGFGASEKDPDREQSPEAISRFVEAFCDELGHQKVNLVIHDWGGAAIDFALKHPERINRLLIMNTPMGLLGWQWHWIARIWRRPVQGELMQATTTKAAMTNLMRRGRKHYRAMPKDWRDAQWAHYDKATRAAVLRLYRSASNQDSDDYAREVEHLFAEVDAPVLILWGDRDPYISSWFADVYAAKFPNGKVEHFDAGHWPWVDRQDVLERGCEFLRG